MLKHTVRNLAVTAITIVSAAALAVLGVTDASAATTYKFIANSGDTALDITANGVGAAVTISNSGTDDNWVLVNTTSWDNEDGVIVSVSELQHAGTDNCVTLSQGAFEMSGCVAGDTDQLFWADPTGSTTNGNTNVWLINVAASNSSEYGFVTAESLTNGAHLVADGPGHGGDAAWNEQCSSSC